MRRAARTDENQVEIVQAFRRMGYSVKPTHQVGDGFPDIVIGKNNMNTLIEIKDGKKPPSARKLTPDEVEFHKKWRGRVEIIESIDDAIKLDKELTNNPRL
jgi:Holliday junction resolvase